MRIVTDTSLIDFDFWAGAKYVATKLTINQLEELDTVLEEVFPDGLSDTELNDIFWFEEDMIAEMLGYSDWEDLLEDIDE